MKNSDYWKQRFTQLENAQNALGASSLPEIEAQYRKAQKEIEAEISRWYQRFADNNGITMQEARSWLTGKDLKEFKWTVQDYIKHGEENAITGQWAKELENASAKFHISRLEALKINTEQSLQVMFAQQQGTITGTLGDVFKSGYYHTAYELQHGFGIGFDVGAVDQSYLEKVLAKPWAADGYNFSERIWKNKDKLISEVHTELSRNILTGGDPQKAIDAIAKKMNTSKNNAGRLVMTEEAYFSSAAQKECFSDLGVEEYEIVATLDSHTSEICQTMDGQHFPMKDFEAGVTAPPFHVNCRSTTAPYFDEDFWQLGERAARTAPGEQTYYVPDDMKYPEWKETFVDGGDKSGLVKGTQLGGSTTYSRPKTPEPEAPPKKEYLTKKKLQAKIAEADVWLEDLEKQFKTVSGGWTYEEAIKDFGSLEDFTDGDDLAKLKSLKSDMDALEAQKAEWEAKLQEKIVAEQKKAIVKEQMQLEAQKAALEQRLAGMDIKTYSGIWKDDVTTADFAHLNIEGKKKYYEGKFITETDPALMQKYQDLYKQLQELETEGKAYADVEAEIKKIEKELSKLQSDLKNLENGGIINNTVEEAFTQARKDAAMWAKSTQEADKRFRDKCGEVWRAAPKSERLSIYDYTSGSGKFNRPLSGFEGSWGQHANKGVGKVDLNYEGGYKHIKGATQIIEKSTYDFDMWLQRGCGTEAIESFLNLPNGTLSRMTEAELQQFVGSENRIYSFLSTGVAKGKGFSGSVIMNVYAPEGTQMMYCEPFSAFGNGMGKNWDGIATQSHFGYESEMLIQRGAYYRITKIEKKGGTIFMDVEVHPERGYEFVEDLPGYTGTK